VVSDNGSYTGIYLSQVRWIDPNSISDKETPDIPQLSPERRAEVVETVQQIRQIAAAGIDPYSKTEQKTPCVLIDFARAGHPIGCIVVDLFWNFYSGHDGGDVYRVDANTGNAVALKTRDGSLKADLYFVGENCNGNWLDTVRTHCTNRVVGVSSCVSHGMCAPECRLHPIPAGTGLRPVHHQRPAIGDFCEVSDRSFAATDPIATNDHLRALQRERSHHCHHA
jgi:hypothetical protein